MSKTENATTSENSDTAEDTKVNKETDPVTIVRELSELGFHVRKNTIDPAMQQRQLLMYMLPCPPLPMIVLRGSNGDEHESVVSSHDVIAVGMENLHARVRTDAEFAFRYERNIMAIQLALHYDFTCQMDDVFSVYKHVDAAKQGRDADVVQAVYNVMKDYTRRKVAEYMPWITGKGDLPDVRFSADPDLAVGVGDFIHKKTVEYICGNRLAAGSNIMDPESLHKMRYSELLVLHWQCYCMDGVLEKEGKSQPGIELDSELGCLALDTPRGTVVSEITDDTEHGA